MRVGLGAGAGPMTKMTFLDEPPLADGLTQYDKQQLVTYLRLLDADAEGADWREVTQIVFGINAGIDEERALRVYHAHLARAQWMRDSGFQHLLGAQQP